MPRPLRITPGGLVFHVLNRANARSTIFSQSGDYAAFERVLLESLRLRPLELLSYCIMPNHWHLVVRPHEDGDLSQFMRWLTVTHTQRWHAAHHTSGTGHIYQGRFKSFPVESDDQHFLAVCRYVERNALRATLVQRAEQWRWSSLWRRLHTQTQGMMSPWPVDEPADWLELLNQPQSAEEEEALRRCMNRGVPFGTPAFQEWTLNELGLISTLHPRGRPKRSMEPK